MSAIIAQSLSALPIPHVYADENASVALSDDELLYKDVIDRYVNDIIPNGIPEDERTIFSDKWWALGGSSERNPADYGYSFYDIDGDGVSELFVGNINEKNAYEIYTVYENTPKMIANGGTRYDCYVGESENVVIMTGANGATSHSCIFYHLTDGELKAFKHYLDESGTWYVAEGEDCDTKTVADMTAITEEEVIIDNKVDVFAEGMTTFADYSAKSESSNPEENGLSAKELTEIFNKFYDENLANIVGGVWDYFELHDYDGNGTLEGFSVSHIEQGLNSSVIYFINSDGEITKVDNMDYSEPNSDAVLLTNPKKDTEFKYYYANSHGFLTYTTDSDKTAILSVRNNQPYILDTTELNGFYQKENGSLYTLVEEDVDEYGNAIYAEYYLIYDEETGNLKIGDRVEEIVDDTNYQCGENAFWSFDEETGTLKISGTGSMYDYDNAQPFFSYDPETDPPYSAFADKIKVINIEKGITHIGNKAFHGTYVNLEEILLPEGLKTIGDDAFNIMFFDEVPSRAFELPEEVILVGDRAFYALTNVAIESEGIFIPRSVKYIGENAFGFYGYIENLNDEEAQVIKMEGFKIQGYKDTEAQKYAKDNGFEFEEFVDLDENGYVIEYTTVSGGRTSSSSSSSGGSVQSSPQSTSPKTGVTAPVGATVAGLLAVAGVAFTIRKKED